MSLHNPLDWLFGDIFSRRLEYEAQHPEVLWSRLIRSLRQDLRAATPWCELIEAYRAVLLEPAAAPVKIAEDLQLATYDFSGKLLDAFAEVLAVLQLAKLGASQFEMVARIVDQKTPDFLCLFNGCRTAVEVKNLRSHDFAEKVMLDLFLDAQLKAGKEAALQLVTHRSDRSWLKRNEIREMATLVERLPTFAPDVTHRVSLSTGVAVVFHLQRGGNAHSEDAISLDDLRSDYSLREGLSAKVRRTAAAAVPQLFSSALTNIEQRLLAMRWDIPWYGLPFPEDLADTVRAALDREFQGCAGAVQKLIFTDFEYILLAPTEPSTSSPLSPP